MDTSRELRTLVSVLAGLTEYYRLHGQSGPGGFGRLLDRIAKETARIDALIHTLEGTVQDEAGLRVTAKMSAGVRNLKDA